jgi:hypothetical protein
MGDWQRQWKRVAPFVAGTAVLVLAAGLQAQCNQEPCAVAGAKHVEAAPQGMEERGQSMDRVDAARALDGLVTQLQNRSSIHRVEAVEAIAASATADPEKVNRTLRDALEDEDPVVADAALSALVRRGEDPGLTESELQRNRGEYSELARVQLAARNRDSSALKELMGNGDAVVQEAAFAELATEDPKAAVEALKEELFDRNSLYRVQTLELFVRSPYANSSATLMPVLEEASRDDDAMVKERAEAFLKEKQAEIAPKAAF